MNPTALWQTKLHARLHDPAEKPLVLMRIPGESHEQGTSAELRKAIFGSSNIPDELKEVLEIADRWAAAGDRPNFPRELIVKADGQAQLTKKGEPLFSQNWANVRFTSDAELVHPLSGARIEIGDLRDIGPQQIKDAALSHFSRLLVYDAAGAVDVRRSALTFWRFGPEWSAAAAKTAGEHESEGDLTDLHGLWSLLPADSRTPDHTIWQHLDLASAFAGALHDGDTPALLVMSIGPVQDFIAASRSTSDLWAGSHLLSRIAWEGMKVFCETIGPDALLMPQLRGVPQVDAWVYAQLGDGKDSSGQPLRDRLFAKAEWRNRSTDANPLFAAALPNKWLVIVPEKLADSLAKEAEAAMREFVRKQTAAAYRLLLKAAELPDADEAIGIAQIEAQLNGFPEVHWACVPWTLAGKANLNAKAETAPLAQALSGFYPGAPKEPGFLDTETSPAWKLLRGDIELDKAKFWEPNPGLLYPALHDLAERALAATKSLRPFSALDQQGYRCTLSAETEWLRGSPKEQAHWSKRQRKENGTLWTQVAGRFGIKAGEHLGALGTLKRLWPTLFVNELEDLHLDIVSRFVVSSHTMALAGSLAKLTGTLDANQRKALDQLKAHPCWKAADDRVALPRRLANDPGRFALPLGELAKLPAVLDYARDSGDGENRNREDVEQREQWRSKVEELLSSLLGQKPENYYALIKLDGDRMGAWVNGDFKKIGKAEDAVSLPYGKLLHSKVEDHLKKRGEREIADYLKTNRAISPSYHMALSGALNRFALDLARSVVEERHAGRLLYAGGDDVMAMSTVSDLLPTLLGLRCVYSGVAVPDELELGEKSKTWKKTKLGNGFIQHKGQLTRLMGEHATASAGAVIAHHKAPLAAVLRELEAAEKRAKNAGGRNAFSLSVVKRSGGALYLTLPWGLDSGESSPLQRLLALAKDMVDGSRRAPFNIMQWVRDLPLPEPAGLLKALLHHQFSRQKIGAVPELNADAVIDALRAFQTMPIYTDLQHKVPDTLDASQRKDWLAEKRRAACEDFLYNYLSVADFLARDGRIAGGAA